MGESRVLRLVGNIGKGLVKYPVKAVDTLVDHVCAIFGALTLCQVPGFISHYVQRLGGHVAEAARNVETWREAAEKTGHETIKGYAEVLLRSDLQEHIEAGKKCLGDVLRLEELQDAYTALTEAPPWQKAFAFLRHADADIARGTLEKYVPNLPLDLESIVYALVGLVLALLLYRGGKSLARAGYRGISRLKKPQPEPQPSEETENETQD